MVPHHAIAQMPLPSSSGGTDYDYYQQQKNQQINKSQQDNSAPQYNNNKRGQAPQQTINGGASRHINDQDQFGQ